MGGNRGEMSPPVTEGNIGEASPLVTEGNIGETTPPVTEDNRDEGIPLVMGGNKGETTTLSTDGNREEASPLGRRSDRWEASALVTGGALPALSIITPKNPVRAITNQTVLLPFSFQSLNSAWEFIYIKWEFIRGIGNHPILVYMLDNCTGTAHNWWERTCQLTKEVAKKYQQRADICQNATLVIRDVQAADAGMYLVTVRTLDVWANATVNLMVTEGKFAWKSLSPINTIRMVFACLVLCILALIVREYIHASGSNIAQCEETLGPPETPDGGAPLVGATQHIIVVSSTSASFHGQ
ncbi:hypothetical protein KIL84_004395 [Mauremys mutica]|uniref:Uncharacterized protein n=1 Tax=Mauremys mutica TaxID=74926 RepID=A0A9D3XPA5_9SAUR|nr:hypothetical protein KIL84_004395 [Mauremys mutica]